MRNHTQEITDRAAIDDIIRRCPACHLGLSDEGQPYVVPLCFGYEGETLYFHCASQGLKLDLLRKNPKVCVEFSLTEGVTEAAQACAWGMTYESVIATGTACFVEDVEEKRQALNLLMAQYADPKRSFTFPAMMLKRMVVFKIPIETITGKRSS
jgi:uncharacterized protein